jgi:Uri superfamily endonuclease
MDDGPTGGTYTLLLDLPEAVDIAVGALGSRRFPAGAYAYTGSALGSGGFARVDRHRRVAAGDHDVRHWHIDYLAGHSATTLAGVVTSPGVDAECAIARRLPAGPVDGFGASDCRCRSHLAVDDDIEALRTAVEAAHRQN